MRPVALFSCALALGLALVAAPASATKPSKSPSHEKHASRTDKDTRKQASRQRERDKNDKRDRNDKDDKPASIGAPNAGKITGASRLKRSRSLVQRAGSHSWGLPQLTQLLHRAAAHVARKHRGSVLFVADLSARHGGPLPGHHSHQSGRDADLAFYVTNSKGKPLPTKRFIAFDGEGKARDGGSVRFDDDRNWELVAALLEDHKVHVHYLFISAPLKARLLEQARKKHASKALLLRAAQAMLSPEHAEVHDDHFHVRISCPTSMRGTCVEESVARAYNSPAKDTDGAGGGSAEGDSNAKSDAPDAPADANASAPADANAPSASPTDPYGAE